MPKCRHSKKYIKVYLTEQEMRLIARNAAKARLSMSKYARRVCLGYEPKNAMDMGPIIPKLDFTTDKKAILANTAMLTKDKKKLLAILTLKEKTQIDAKLTISPSGVLILSLPSGGTIRDSGKQLYFSKFDPQRDPILHFHQFQISVDMPAWP